MTLRLDLQPASESNEIELAIRGRVVPREIARLSEIVEALLSSFPEYHLICDLAALDDPDAAAIDALARLELIAHKHRCRVRLRHVSSELQELLDLAGLWERGSVR